MKLCTHYLDFMTQGVGLILTQGMTIPIGTADNNFLLMVALYMSADPEANEIFTTNLESKSDVVAEVWHRFYNMVLRFNEAGLVVTNESLNAAIKGVSNEDNGKDSG